MSYDLNAKAKEVKKIVYDKNEKNKDKERTFLYFKIIERAEKEGLYNGQKLNLMMDIESADKKFNLRLNEWLNADKFNFAHDLFGIMNNIVRNEFPSSNFGSFVPRFAGQYN